MANGNDPANIPYIIVDNGFYYVAYKEKAKVPEVVVSAKGVANGLSEEYNDGWDFGPDSYNPNSTEAIPYTQTSGIQEAINYWQNNNYPRIYMRNGIYNLSGKVSSGTPLILVPYITNPTSNTVVPLYIEGESASFNTVTNVPSTSLNLTGVIWYVVNPQPQATDNAMSVFFTPHNPSDSTPGQAYFNAVQLYMRNITIIQQNPATIDAFHLQNFAGVDLDNIIAGVDTTYANITASPYTPGGIIMPDSGYYLPAKIGAAKVVGYYSGMISTGDVGPVEYFEADSVHDILVLGFGGTGTGYINMLFGSEVVNGIVCQSSNTRINVKNLGLATDGGTYGSFEYYVTTLSGDGPLYGTCGIEVQSGTNVTPLPATNNSPYFKLIPLLGSFSGCTLSANPPVSGTVYQNLNACDIRIYFPAYATTAGTAGSVKIALGSTSTPSTIGTKFINGSTSSSATDIIELVVPAGWYYEFTLTGVTLGTATVFSA